MEQPTEEERINSIKETLRELRKKYPKLGAGGASSKKSYFSNVSQQPLNRIHLEKLSMKPIKDLPEDMDEIDVENIDVSKYFQKTREVVPALDKAWIYVEKSYSEFQHFCFEFSKEENTAFIRKNVDFIYQLNSLLAHNYHKFWCYILYEPRLVKSIINFLLKPVFWYELEYLSSEQLKVYLGIYNKVYKVYQRLLKFRHSDTEYMEEETVLQYLEETELLSPKVVINFATLYGERNPNMVNNLITYCCSQKRRFNFPLAIKKHVKQCLVIFEMIGGYVCGFEENAVIVPIELEPKPKTFRPQWYISVLTYTMNTIASLHTVFSVYKESIHGAIDCGLSYRMTYFYDNVFPKIHSILDFKWPVKSDLWLKERIHSHLFKCRAKFVQTFDLIISYQIDQILLHVGDPSRQTKHVEQYLKMLTSAMEDDMFFMDYNAQSHIDTQIENIRELYPEIDQTRTDYILQCISNFERKVPWKVDNETQTVLTAIEQMKSSSQKVQHEDDVLVLDKLLMDDAKCLNCDRIPKDIIESAMAVIAAIPSGKIKLLNGGDTGNVGKVNSETSVPETSKERGEQINKISEEKIDEAIATVSSMLPHLGDGFILKCLDYYNYNAEEVVSAILDENLAPHLMDVPFNEIRIPAEPEPPKPVKQHIGKKPFEYKDARDLLDDKSELTSSIREAISNRFLYDDDYDDGLEDVETQIDYSMLGRDNLEGYPSSENRAKFPVIEERESEDETDDEEPPDKNDKERRDAFCEDPAVIRERRERQRQGGSKGWSSQLPKPQTDVRGKPKGQGQDKNVVISRDKKNTNKSSRANHNRKSGAQWKRSRAMLPS